VKTSVAPAFLFATALVLAGCSSVGEDAIVTDDTVVTETAPAAPNSTLFATTTILGTVLDEIVTCVGNDAVAVDVLMPIGADPHDFAPSSEQMALMAGAGIIVANGLGLEGGLDDTFDQLEADGVTVLHVAEWIDPLPFAEMATDDHDNGHDEERSEEEAEGDEHAHGEFDPHFWLDMSRMAEVARQLGVELEPLLGADAVACGEDTASAILATEQEVIDTLSAIDDDRRLLVTDHEAFSYFANRYDFEIAGVVIPGGSTLAEPSSQELAALVATIEELSVPALMGNIHEQSDLLTAVAAESGGLSVVSLYVGSVGGSDSEAADYRSMMLTNAKLIADALSAG
jgi:zinc/manganese transport system substrate-binding protein